MGLLECCALRHWIADFTLRSHLQGRPFREGITENSALYYGLLGVAAVAFSGATDFVPEFNRWLQLVEMKSSVRLAFLPSFPSTSLTYRSRPFQFRFQLCAVMVLDYGGSWIAEIVLKYFFADNQPKPVITRGIERREARRAEEQRLLELEEEKKAEDALVKKDL